MVIKIAEIQQQLAYSGANERLTKLYLLTLQKLLNWSLSMFIYSKERYGAPTTIFFCVVLIFFMWQTCLGRCAGIKLGQLRLRR
jgi:hypothetical protein